MQGIRKPKENKLQRFKCQKTTFRNKHRCIGFIFFIFNCISIFPTLLARTSTSIVNTQGFFVNNITSALYDQYDALLKPFVWLPNEH